MKTIVAAAMTAKLRAGTRLFVTAALLALVVLPTGPATAQDFDAAKVTSRLNSIRSVFDYVETGISPNARRSELQRLRNSIEPLRNELQQRVEDLTPRLADFDLRLKALGAEPAKDTPAESPEVATQRKQLTENRNEIDGLIKQTRVLITRGDQIAERIDERRRARLADRLLERNMSLLDPKLWLGTAEALPAELGLARKSLSDWYAGILELPRIEESAAIALGASIAIFIAIFLLRGWLRRRIAAAESLADGAPLPRLRRAKAALRDSILNAAALPLAVYAAVEIFSSFNFISGTGNRAAVGLISAITLFSIGRALAGALLRPGDAPQRVLSVSDSLATRLYKYATSALLIAAVGAFINVVHRSLGAPRIMLAATSALMAAGVAAIIVRGLLKTRQIADETNEDLAPNWLRLILWIVGIVILGAVITGYIWLASFMTSRLVHAAIVVASSYVVFFLINAYFDEGLHAQSPRGRAFASTLGIRPQSLDLAAALLAGVGRVLVVVVALFLVIGNWGTSLTDLVASFDRVSFGIELGKLRLSLYDIIASIALLLVGIVLARIVQNWLSNTVLPRTRMDMSLKNSIATIVGYIGVIVAISFALARLGLNFENIALIAGALSVGIGFGLQAIVSNFVSGLILLTERPIKVGDMVNVKGAEGHVRRISVRSTEVETFDRASVIIPNSEFITSAVTNWTHKNQIARISVKVGVAYDSDVEMVREILLREAKSHKRVIAKPEPVVFFMEFGDSALNFELRCIIDSADFMMATKSDLHFAILRAFREAKIEIPFPQQDLRIIDPSGNGGPNLRQDGDGAAKPAPTDAATSDRGTSK